MVWVYAAKIRQWLVEEIIIIIIINDIYIAQVRKSKTWLRNNAANALK